MDAQTSAPWTHREVTVRGVRFHYVEAGEGEILEHRIQIPATHYLAVDDTLIPTGTLAPVKGTFMDFFEARTIGGKEVFVGSPAMLRQSEHQRGTPYLYQTDDTMFLIITDDEAWAREALAALP